MGKKSKKKGGGKKKEKVESRLFDALGKAIQLGLTEDVVLERVKQLLEEGENVNQQEPQRGGTALHLACQVGLFSLAKLLLERGAEVDKPRNTGATPLFMASQKGHIAVALILIEFSYK